MADTQYVISGTTNPSANGTSEVVLSVDKDGNPSKVISDTVPATLTDADKKTLEDLGVTIDSVSQKEADELVESSRQPSASDTAATAPSLGGKGTNPGGAGPAAGAANDR